MDIFSATGRYGWRLQAGNVDYERALEWQRSLVAMREQGLVRDTIILCEHPPVITVGRDRHDENFEKCRLKPFFIERGGDVTYHGPGQQVVYFIFNLTRRGRDLHRFMAAIQDGVIDTLATYEVKARKDNEHTGVWVDKHKIASVGIAVKRWITFHGAAININTDLSEFKDINPCGLDSEVMTSLAALKGRTVDMSEFSGRLLEAYSSIFETEFNDIDLEDLAETLESQHGGDTV